MHYDMSCPPDPYGGMTNNERFNIMLNACQNPRAVYAALLALGSMSILNESREGAAR